MRRRKPVPREKRRRNGVTLLERLAPAIVIGILIAIVLIWLLGALLGAPWA
jgi:type II secretory pathway pseudopilin PulG